MTDPCLLTATVLTEKVRRREIGARELLEAFIHRYERFNPAVNAVIWTDLSAARRRADQADAALAKGEHWGPLHGLPITIKESFDFKGAPTTWGVGEKRGNIGKSNAVAVQRLLDAGAVI